MAGLGDKVQELGFAIFEEANEFGMGYNYKYVIPGMTRPEARAHIKQQRRSRPRERSTRPELRNVDSMNFAIKNPASRGWEGGEVCRRMMTPQAPRGPRHIELYNTRGCAAGLQPVPVTREVCESTGAARTLE